MSRERNAGEERFRRREKKDKEYRDQIPAPDEEPLPPPVEPIETEKTPDRNEPCPCGSGKKYKKCCGKPGR